MAKRQKATKESNEENIPAEVKSEFPGLSPKNKIILDALKKQYFDLCVKEKIGETTDLTKQIDILQEEIRKLGS